MEADIDQMLQELLLRCISDNSNPLPDKSTLLNDSLKAVLHICNDSDGVIKEHLTTL